MITGIKLITLFIAAYLIGSINFSILLFKLLGKDDPRNKFSGNAGTTNVLRQAGKFWATSVLLLDVGRAYAMSVLSLYLLDSIYSPIIGLALIAGNRFPCFHGFRGGKGVASYLGFTANIAPLWTAASAGVWVLVYAIARLPFVASIFMAIALAWGTIYSLEYNPIAVIGSTITALLIILNHRKNFIAFKNNRKNITTHKAGE